MTQKDVYDEILTQAFKRMHRYTCAEASLQALLSLWDLPLEQYSWAMGGYLGAIMSGETTCGLLIGSIVALGFRCGLGKDGIPEQNEDERNKAVQAVGELYNNFLVEFGSTKCKELSRTDFSKGEEITQYLATKGWKQTCDVFLEYVLRECKTMAEEGKV